MSEVQLNIKAPAENLREQIRNRAHYSEPISPLSDTITVPKFEAFHHIDSFLGQFTPKKVAATLRGVRSLAEREKRGGEALFCLNDVIKEQGVKATDDYFDPVFGGVRLPQLFATVSLPFGRFYREDGRTHLVKDAGSPSEGKGINLRGDNFYVCLDTSLDPKTKIVKIKKDVSQAIQVLQRVDRSTINTPENYFCYFGVLDYLKIHSLAMYHALTYDERFGKFPDGEQERERYEAAKQRAAGVMRDCVRMQYQHLLGLPFDSDITPESLQKRYGGVINELERKMQDLRHNARSAKRINKYFRYPELHHPLVIALGAQEAVREYSDVDMIVGIPTGGTETAIVSQLLFEDIHKRKPPIHYLPLSLHSEIRISDTQNVQSLSDKIVAGNIHEEVVGKKILLIDDNSSTGQTLENITDALTKRGAHEVFLHVGEFDARRWIDAPHGISDTLTYFNPNMSPTTTGIAPMEGERHKFLAAVAARMQQKKK